MTINFGAYRVFYSWTSWAALECFSELRNCLILDRSLPEVDYKILIKIIKKLLSIKLDSDILQSALNLTKPAITDQSMSILSVTVSLK